MSYLLAYRPDHCAYFAANQSLFNQVASFYFDVIQAHVKVLDLSNKEALTALEKLTHATETNHHPVQPLSDIQEDIPAMFQRAAINAALGPARSFYSNLDKWRKRKEKADSRGKKFTERPPVPPRTWNKSATLYEGRAIFRCCHLPRCRSWKGTIHSSHWAWGSQRAWHRSGTRLEDG